MRKQRILTLHRKLTPKAPQRYGVRFTDDDPHTIRMLPCEWCSRTDHAEKWIHIPVPVEASNVELFDGDYMDMLKHEHGSTEILYAWTNVLSNVGYLEGINDMTIYKVSEVRP